MSVILVFKKYSCSPGRTKQQKKKKKKKKKPCNTFEQVFGMRAKP